MKVAERRGEGALAGNSNLSSWVSRTRRKNDVDRGRKRGEREENSLLPGGGRVPEGKKCKTILRNKKVDTRDRVKSSGSADTTKEGERMKVKGRRA